jgi:hypothetical protein
MMLSFYPPNGPSTPFASTGLFVIDSIRVFIVVLGLFAIFLTPRAMIMSHTIGQKARLGATALFIIAAISTEYNHFGDYGHWRLLAHLFAAAFAAWGVWALLRWERPSEFRTN